MRASAVIGPLAVVLGLGASSPARAAPPPPPVPLDPTSLVTGPPVGTDAASFVAKELAGATSPTPVINEFSGEEVGTDYTLPKDQAIRGVPCRAASPVHVGNDGHWSCTLSAAWATGPVRMLEGNTVTAWIATAHLSSVPIHKHADGGPVFSLGAVLCGDSAELDRQGRLSSCVIVDAGHVFQGGLQLPVGTMAYFDGEGRVVSAHLTAEAIVQGTRYGEYWMLSFDASGKVTHAFENYGD